MNSVPKLLFVAAMLCLGGCATVIKGSSQDILIDSDPQGASCELTRSGVILGQVNPTPAKFKVSRDKDALSVACNKAGYGTGRTTVESKFNGATFGNILLGGVIGVVVDASSGANYTYPEQIMVVLPPEGDAAMPPAGPSVAPPAPAEPPKPAVPAAPPTPPPTPPTPGGT